METDTPALMETRPATLALRLISADSSSTSSSMRPTDSVGTFSSTSGWPESGATGVGDDDDAGNPPVKTGAEVIVPPGEARVEDWPVTSADRRKRTTSLNVHMAASSVEASKEGKVSECVEVRRGKAERQIQFTCMLERALEDGDLADSIGNLGGNGVDTMHQEIHAAGQQTRRMPKSNRVMAICKLALRYCHFPALERTL